LTIADYLVWGGWICALGWFACSTRALYILIDHPLDEETKTDSVVYLKVSELYCPGQHFFWEYRLTVASPQTVFVSCYFFDTGLYFPKASLVAFYWWLIPQGFRRLRISVYASTAIIACSWVASILTDTLLTPTISDNWYGTPLSITGHRYTS
jgi:hypothetical protein